jgi:hypothetical protein
MELIVALWIVLAVVVAWAANARGRDSSFWLLFAIIASPPIAAIILLALPNSRAD